MFILLKLLLKGICCIRDSMRTVLPRKTWLSLCLSVLLLPQFFRENFKIYNQWLFYCVCVLLLLSDCVLCVCRFELGTGLFLGWGAASLNILGGALLCSACKKVSPGAKRGYERHASPEISQPIHHVVQSSNVSRIVHRSLRVILS